MDKQYVSRNLKANNAPILIHPCKAQAGDTDNERRVLSVNFGFRTTQIEWDNGTMTEHKNHEKIIVLRHVKDYDHFVQMKDLFV